MVQEPEAPLLSVEELTAGINFERTVVLESVNDVYHGKAVKIRSLRGSEFKRLLHKYHVTEDADASISWDMALEACQMGMIDKALAARAADLDREVIEQIGNAIIMASRPKPVKEAEDFSIAQTGSQST
jgi:hypothetical protein